MQRCIEIVTCQGILINIACIIMAGSFTPHLTEDSSSLQRKMRNYLPKSNRNTNWYFGPHTVIMLWMRHVWAIIQSKAEISSHLYYSVFLGLISQLLLSLKSDNTDDQNNECCAHNNQRLLWSIQVYILHKIFTSSAPAVFYLLFSIVYQCLGKLHINKRYCCVKFSVRKWKQNIFT